MRFNRCSSGAACAPRAGNPETMRRKEINGNHFSGQAQVVK